MKFKAYDVGVDGDFTIYNVIPEGEDPQSFDGVLAMQLTVADWVPQEKMDEITRLIEKALEGLEPPMEE
jgi:hypothetical protein